MIPIPKPVDAEPLYPAKSTPVEATGKDRPKLPFGTRVLCLKSSDDKICSVFGEGVYEKDDIPSEEAAGVLSLVSRKLKREVPVILLDSGTRVYGSECYWGALDKGHAYQARLAAKGIESIPVDIWNTRREFKESFDKMGEKGLKEIETLSNMLSVFKPDPARDNITKGGPC